MCGKLIEIEWIDVVIGEQNESEYGKEKEEEKKILKITVNCKRWLKQKTKWFKKIKFNLKKNKNDRNKNKKKNISTSPSINECIHEYKKNNFIIM